MAIPVKASGKVWCRSEFDYATQPQALEWEGRRINVRQVVSACHTPQGRSFQVLTTDGRFFTLDYDEGRDYWLVHLS